MMPDREREVVLAGDGEVALVGLGRALRAGPSCAAGSASAACSRSCAGDAEQRERVPAAQAQQRDELRERELRRDALDAFGEEGEVLGAEAVERVGVGQARLGVAARRGAEQEGDDVERHVPVAAVRAPAPPWRSAYQASAWKLTISEKLPPWTLSSGSARCASDASVLWVLSAASSRRRSPASSRSRRTHAIATCGSVTTVSSRRRPVVLEQGVEVGVAVRPRRAALETRAASTRPRRPSTDTRHSSSVAVADRERVGGDAVEDVVGDHDERVGEPVQRDAAAAQLQHPVAADVEAREVEPLVVERRVGRPLLDRALAEVGHHVHDRRAARTAAPPRTRRARAGSRARSAPGRRRARPRTAARPGRARRARQSRR